MSDTPTPPTLADLREQYDEAVLYFPTTTEGLARTEERFQNLIATAQREAVRLYWCPSCRTLRPKGDTDIHTCADADALQRARIAELEAEVAALREAAP